MLDQPTNPDIRRPALRWHGGKWRLAPWIISHFPRHRVYVEPFGGAASVLLRKRRSHGEVYNDLDQDTVGLFRLLRDPAGAAELIRRLELTPFARDEFDEAYEAAPDPVERARRFIVRSFMGFGADGVREDLTTGFRSNANRNGTTPAQDWANYPPALAAIVERIAGVVIENRDAQACMLQHDERDALHYVDPPYLPETRQMDHRGHGYRHELTTEQHVELLRYLRAVEGMVVLSGYPAPLYDELLPDWQRRDVAGFADGGRARTECLWLNPACVEALGHGPLFDAPASA